MICKNCNYESDKNFAFCPKCGAKCEPEEPQVTTEETTVLQPSDSPFAQQPAQTFYSAPDPQPSLAVQIGQQQAKKKRKLPVKALSIIAAIVVVLGVLTCVFWQRIEMAILGEGTYYIKHELSTVENQTENIIGDFQDVQGEFTLSGDLNYEYEYEDDSDDPNLSEYIKPVYDKQTMTVDLRFDPDSGKAYFYFAEKHDGDVMGDYLIQYDGEYLAISSPKYDKSKQFVVNLKDSVSSSVGNTLDIDEDVLDDLIAAIAKDAIAPALEAEEPEVDSGKFNGTSCTTVKFTINKDSAKVFIDALKEIVEKNEDFEVLLHALTNYLYDKGADIGNTSELRDMLTEALENCEKYIDFDEEFYYTVYFDGGDVVSRQLEMKGKKETVEINSYTEGDTTAYELIAGDREYALKYTADSDEISGEIYYKYNGEKRDSINFSYAGLNDIKIKEDGETVFEFKGDDKIEVEFNGYSGKLNYTEDADFDDIDIDEESYINLKEFGRVMNGSPYDAIQNFYDSSFSYDAEQFTKSASPYVRSQYLDNMEYYSEYKDMFLESGYGDYDFDLDVDINDDEKFSVELKKFFELLSVDMNVDRKASDYTFSNLEYYKSYTDEYKDLLTEYKEQCDSTEGITLFAKVTVKFSYFDKDIQKSTTQTTNGQAVDETEATQPTTSETKEAEADIICVKINGDWYFMKEITE